MPSLCPQDRRFLSEEFESSSVVDSRFFLFTGLPVSARLPLAAEELGKIKIENPDHTEGTVRDYADTSMQLAACFTKDAGALLWLNELIEAPLLSEALTNGTRRHLPEDIKRLNQCANRVLTEGAEDGYPLALHHQNCLRILSGHMPGNMAGRMSLMLGFHTEQIDSAIKNRLADLYEVAPGLNFAQLRHQALRVEELHQALDECRSIKAGGASKLAASFGIINSKTFDVPAMQAFYTAFCKSYFTDDLTFQQALSVVSDAADPKKQSPAPAPAPGSRAP